MFESQSIKPISFFFGQAFWDLLKDSVQWRTLNYSFEVFSFVGFLFFPFSFPASSRSLFQSFYLSANGSYFISRPRSMFHAWNILPNGRFLSFSFRSYISGLFIRSAALFSSTNNSLSLSVTVSFNWTRTPTQSLSPNVVNCIKFISIPLCNSLTNVKFRGNSTLYT